jgi:pSer/pThr/pTyr-binding forkhead associated (FHA) protein
MDSARVTLTVVQGSLKGNEYVFEEPIFCLAGRAEDCNIHLPASLAHADVSRHHCLLEIAPPGIRIRDLGSRNGTFVNERKIGQRPFYLSPEEADLGSSKTVELGDGDEIRMGNTVLQVGVAVPNGRPVSVYFPMSAASL